MDNDQQQSPNYSAEAGAAIYSKKLLSVYDLGVIQLSNRFVWRCPSNRILDFYNQHITTNHLDVGVGTGYFLDHCIFPGANPRIALLDLNPNSLNVTAKRLERYHPAAYLTNVLEAISLGLPKFDSIALNYLLHCLPGNMNSKQVVFQNLLPCLNRGGKVFGTTILGQGVSHNLLAQNLMTLYNSKGIFSNRKDKLSDLESVLKRNFSDYSTQVVGCVAFFTGQV